MDFETININPPALFIKHPPNNFFFSVLSLWSITSHAHLRLRIPNGQDRDPAAGAHPAGGQGPDPEVALPAASRGVNVPGHEVAHLLRETRPERSDRDPAQDHLPEKRAKRRRNESKKGERKKKRLFLPYTVLYWKITLLWRVTSRSLYGLRTRGRKGKVISRMKCDLCHLSWTKFVL